MPIDLALFRHWPVAIGLLSITCLLSSAAQAQRPSIAAQQAQIATLQSQVAALQTAPIQGLNGYVSMDLSTPSRPTVKVAGANLQVVNGLGSTYSVNGLGNVIVGYDEPSSALSLPAVCSLGQYTTQSTCNAGTGSWGVEHKEGSHNLVVGPYHRYALVGGLVAGFGNTVNALDAAVSGGQFNTASGQYSSVSGGSQNTASADSASISAGYGNVASFRFASVSGGGINTASGDSASVSGGVFNTASALNASVGGGSNNIASGSYSSVSGGGYNTASAISANVSGGLGRTVSTNYFWVGGNSLAPQ